MAKRYTPRKPYGRRGSYKTKRNTTPATSYKGKFRIKKRMNFKKKSLQSIKVKNDGICTTFDHNFNKRSKFGMKMAHKYDTDALNVMKNQYAAIITLTAGFQAYTEFAMWSVSELTNRILNTAGQAPGIAGNLVNTARTFLTKCVAETAFTNTTSANIELDLYLFNCKRDGSNVSSLWTSGMYDESAQLATDWTTAGYGVTPFDSKAVGEFWKCYKVIHIFLGPGQSHVHRDTIHLDKMLNNEILEATPSTCLAGYTKSMLCVIKGMPVTSSVNGGLVTTSNGKVDFVRVETYEFKYALDNDTNFKYTYNNVLSATPGQVYNQGAGTVGAVIST